MPVIEHELHPKNFKEIRKAWKEGNIIKLKLPESVEKAHLVRNYDVKEIYIIPTGVLREIPGDSTVLSGILPTKKGAIQVYVKETWVGQTPDDAKEDPYTIVHIKERGARGKTYVIQIGTKPEYSLEEAVKAGDKKAIKRYVENVFKFAVKAMKRGKTLFDLLPKNVSHIGAFDVATKKYRPLDMNATRVKNIVNGDFRVVEYVKTRKGPLARIFGEDPKRTFARFKQYKNVKAEELNRHSGLLRRIGKELGIVRREYYVERDPTEEEKRVLLQMALHDLGQKFREEMATYPYNAPRNAADKIMEEWRRVEDELLRNPAKFLETVQQDDALRKRIIESYLRDHREFVAACEGRLEEVCAKKAEQWMRLLERGGALFKKKIKAGPSTN